MGLQLLIESELPTGWEMLSLSEVRQIHSQSLNPLKEPDSTFELYSIPSHETGRPEITQGQAIGSNKQFVNTDDVLLSKINPRLNRAWLVGDFSEYSKIASTEWVVFKAEENGVVPLYLCHLLQQIKLRDFLCQNASGVGGSLTRVKPSLFDNVQVGLPPLNEQHRIVAKIEELFSELEKGVESLKTAREQLKIYRQSVLKSAFEGRLTESWRKGHSSELESTTELLARIKAEREARFEAQLTEWQQAMADWEPAGGKASGKKRPAKPRKPKELPPLTDEELATHPELPEGWRWIRLVNVTHTDVGFAFKSKDFTDRGIRLLRGDNIEPGKLRWDGAKCWPENRLEGFVHLLISDGDVILAMDRPVISTGLKIAVANPRDLPALLVQRVARVTTNNNDSNLFYFQQMNTNRFVAHCLGNQTGTQLPHISGGQIESFVVAVAPLSEQHQIVQEIESRFSVVEQMERAIDEGLKKAEALRQSILKRAFEGKLVPQDENDEPASALLARIKAEREMSQQSKNRRKNR